MLLSRLRRRAPVGADRLRPSDEIRKVEEDGRFVLLDLGRGRYYGMDETATRVWRMLEDGADAAGIVDRLATEYDAPRDRIAGDVERFLAALVRAGLVARR